MWNIVLEGLDFMWKTPTAKWLSKQLGLKIITKKEIVQVFWDDFWNINDWEYTINALNSEDNTVFDRHFMSLLVYWKMTQPDLYKKLVDETKVIKDFLNSNPDSVLAFRFSDWQYLKDRIENNIAKQKLKKKKITEHDLNLLDLNYFSKYIGYFHQIFNRIKQEREARHNIVLLKQNMSKIWYTTANKKIIARYEDLNSN